MNETEKLSPQDPAIQDSQAQAAPVTPSASQTTGPQAHAPQGAASGSCPWQHIAPWQLLQPPKKSFRQRHPLLFWLGIPFVVFAILGTVRVFMEDAEGLPAGDRLAMLRVEGAIMQNREILQWIDRLQRDNSVKGVLLRVDSPGGGAAASQELYAAIVRLREKKPVVAYMGTVAASGGLMVALAGNKVVANPSSVTGSIGVKMDLPQFHGLMSMLGVGRETLTTGAFKDAGSPFKPLSPDERTYLQGVLQDMHSQFVELVAEARKLPMEKVQAIADGRIFTGREALKLNIVDALGGQDVALRLLQEQTGVVSANLLEQPKKKIPWKDFLETMLDIDLGAQRQSAGFLYVY